MSDTELADGPVPDNGPEKIDTAVAIDRANQAAREDHRRMRTNMMISVGCLVVAAVFMLAFFGLMQSRLSSATATYDSVTVRQQTKIDQLAANQAELIKIANELNRKLTEKGGDPVPLPPPVQTEPPAPPLPVPGEHEQQPPLKGDKGDPPSPAEVAIAVSSFCRGTGECRGDDGKPGANGKNATPEQIAAAISTYCDSRGECQGEKGDQGDGPSEEQILAGLTAYCADGRCQGPKGDDGEPGPDPTDEQIAAAVAAYCTDDRCRGDDGEPGDDSTVPGPPGRGIADTRCEDGRLIIEYTDGETDDAGSCAPAPAPTVTVTATPEPTDGPT